MEYSLFVQGKLQQLRIKTSRDVIMCRVTMLGAYVRLRHTASVEGWAAYKQTYYLPSDHCQLKDKNSHGL